MCCYYWRRVQALDQRYNCPPPTMKQPEDEAVPWNSGLATNDHTHIHTHTNFTWLFREVARTLGFAARLKVGQHHNDRHAHTHTHTHNTDSQTSSPGCSGK
eukprot:1147355-Pelagomonas_calceolata.AAC.1